MALRSVNRQRQAPPARTWAEPAPILGINTRQGLDTMQPGDAIRLVNMIPDADVVTVRPGQASHATGVGAGLVEALGVWRGPASSKLVAAGDGELYDASSAGAASLITSSAAYTSDQWQMVNYAGRLFGFNGADNPWDYNGTTLTTTAWTGPADKKKLIQATVLNSFLLIVEADTASFWYPASKAVTGALSEFSLSTIARQGGKLMAVGTWSRDGGSGLDDMLVCVMDSGELLVYQGTDPVVGMSLVGSFESAPPIGRRCVSKVGGDLVVLTEKGPLPVSLILSGHNVDEIVQRSLWGRVTKAFIDLAALYRSNTGWEITPVFTNGRMYVNVPLTTGGRSYQYALYTPSGAWGELRDINAYSWAERAGTIYFGGAGGVVYSHSGAADNGLAIRFDARCAFTYFNRRDIDKKVVALRPKVAVNGTVDCTVDVDIDFRDRALPSEIHQIVGSSDGSSWDADNWDAADWASAPEPVLDWLGAGGEGSTFALRFFGQTSAALRWFSSDYRFFEGT